MSDPSLKLHLRYVALGRRVLRVVGLRSSETARFSTNHFHNTWHILSGCDGAGLLSRLLWGLSFQREKDTFVVIDRAHLVTTPFDGDEANMILLARQHDRVDADVLRAIKLRRRRKPASDVTVRFQTFGLDGAELDEQPKNEDVRRLGGFVCYSAPIQSMRARAIEVRSLTRAIAMDYCFLGEARRYAHAAGEVQIFRHFDDMVSSARVARQAAIGAGEIRTESEREAIQRDAERRKKMLWEARHP